MFLHQDIYNAVNLLDNLKYSSDRAKGYSLFSLLNHAIIDLAQATFNR